MNQAKEDLLLHPVRLRLILAVGGRRVTAQQLANELPDIPQATLYRNINLLANAGILSVVHERRVRNTFERTYALAEKDLSLSVDDLQDAQPEDHVRLFTQFLGQLLGYFARYIRHGSIDYVQDQVVFRMIPVYFSAAERQAFTQAFNAALLPYLKNEPAPERRRVILGLVSVPDVAGSLLPAAGPE